jgi:hypothetical protein
MLWDVLPLWTRRLRCWRGWLTHCSWFQRDLNLSRSLDDYGENLHDVHVSQRGWYAIRLDWKRKPCALLCGLSSSTWPRCSHTLIVKVGLYQRQAERERERERERGRNQAKRQEHNNAKHTSQLALADVKRGSSLVQRRANASSI